MTKKIILLIFTLFSILYVYSSINDDTLIIEAGAMTEQDFPTNI